MRADGLSNAVTGYGGQQDATTQNFYAQGFFRQDAELSAIWTGGGLGRKICSCRPDDMVRSWITFPEDTDGKLLDALDALDARTHITELLYWTELYRGAIMVLGGLDNAPDLEEAARITDKSTLAWLKVYPAPRILSNYSDMVQDPNSPYFEDFEQFRVQRMGSIEAQAGEFKVHRTRCIVSKGIPVPRDPNAGYEFRYLYWGMSRLQAVFDQMADNDTASKSFANMLKEYTVALMKIQGLREILASEDTATADFAKLMDSVARAKSVLNMILLADGDEFTRDTLQTAGWRDAKQMFREELAAVAEVPVPRLFGIPSPGLGSGGADEQATRTYYDGVKAAQGTKLRPIIRQLVRFVAPTVGLPPDIAFEFNPLFEQSEKEIVENRKIVMETDKGYVEMGALDPVLDVRESRWGGNAYSKEMKIDPTLSEEDLVPEPPPAKSIPAPAVPKAKAK